MEPESTCFGSPRRTVLAEVNALNEHTPPPRDKVSLARSPDTPSCEKRPRDKDDVDQDVDQEDQQRKARKRDAAVNLQRAILAAAPSSRDVLEILEGEYCKATLANAIARIAMSAKQSQCCSSLCESLRNQRIAKLWPSIEDRLAVQMRSNSGQLKLEVQMVPEEGPRQWLCEYNAKGRTKQLLADTRSQLKFIAEVPLGLGHVFQGVQDTELTFAYCKVTHKLVIKGKY